jgi:multidrug resistance efflux pump
LKASIEEAAARLQSARVERDAAHVRLARVQRMASQLRADSELDKERESDTLSAWRVEETEASLAKQEKELQAAEQGFLFQRDAPSFEQRANQLDSKIPQMEAEIRETDEKLTAAEKELQDEQQRVNRLAEADLAAPVSGTVWKRNGELGQVVKQNENLLEIADPNTIFVEALLHQSYLATIAPGSKAVVRLTDGRVLSGRIRAVRTLGGADTEASFAVLLPCPDVKQVRVLIDFDPGVRDAALIGRHARVLIVDANPGLMQQAMMWIFARVGV